MRVNSYTNSPGDDNRIEIGGLTEEEKDKLIAALKGVWWVRGQDGKLRFEPGFNPQPEPEDDPRTCEFWPRTPQKVRYSQLNFRDSKEYANSSPSFMIQSLCGYNWTPENYANEARTLKEFGFECLRSKRGDNGLYWEIWCLSGLWSASGLLKEKN